MNARNHPTNTERLKSARWRCSGMAADAQANARAFARLVRDQEALLHQEASIDGRMTLRHSISEFRSMRNLFIGQLRQLRQLLATLGEGGAI